jgi:hypothetical protein
MIMKRRSSSPRAKSLPGSFADPLYLGQGMEAIESNLVIVRATSKSLFHPLDLVDFIRR